MGRFSFHIFFFIFSLCHVTWSTLVAQSFNLGVPFVHPYSKHDYGAATQNWDISQGSSGMMYFANNDGLLTFDGQAWSLKSLPNRTIVRSVVQGETGNVYVGGQDELGYFSPDERGHLRFQSIKDLLPEEFRSFEDVWNLCLCGDTLWMRTSQQICRVTPGGSQGFRPEGEFGYLARIQDKLYAFDNQQGIMYWTGGTWQILPGTSALINNTVTGIISTGDSLWIGTARDGLHLFYKNNLSRPTLPIQDFLVQNRIHSMIRMENSHVAIGTSLAGVVVLSSDFKPLNWINKSNGLQHNYILTMFEDRDHNLWAGLNNGIDYLELNSPFRRILLQPGEESAGYSAIQANGSWWLGTGTGLYQIPYTNYHSPLASNHSQARLVPGLAGQVWGLGATDEGIVVGHHEGCFMMGESINQISDIQGFWSFIPVPGVQDVLVAGTYEGMFLLRKEGGAWRILKKIPGLEESSRILAADDQRVWMAHPYRGVFAIDFSQGIDRISIQKYGQAEGLPADHYNHVFKIFGRVLIGTINGVYEFDSEEHRFRADPVFRQAIGARWVKSMKEDQEGNIWFIMEDGCGRLIVSDHGLKKDITIQWLPELKDRIVKGHEFVYPHDSHHVLFGVDEGFIRYDPNTTYHEAQAPTVVFSGISLLGEQDSLLFGGWTSQSINRSTGDPPVFSHDQNTWRFSVATTRFQQNTFIQYRFYLEGLEDNWLAWGLNSEKEYAQLPPGTYTFHAQCRDAHMRLSEPLAFTFEITPPWYLSQTAKIIYGFIGLGLVIALLLFPQRKFREEKEKLESDLIRKEEARKQEVEALKMQSLSAEITHKNQELATATLHLVQKNETLTRIRGELEKLNKELDDAASRKRIRSLLLVMNEDERLDKDWEQFAYHFDQVHSGFMHRLREEYPQLTPKDHKICAYLRMNLSSKEIAPMMNISVRGVEISRYRLRKKLGLPHEANLNEFMMNF